MFLIRVWYRSLSPPPNPRIRIDLTSTPWLWGLGKNKSIALYTLSWIRKYVNIYSPTFRNINIKFPAWCFGWVAEVQNDKSTLIRRLVAILILAIAESSGRGGQGQITQRSQNRETVYAKLTSFDFHPCLPAKPQLQYSGLKNGKRELSSSVLHLTSVLRRGVGVGYMRKTFGRQRDSNKNRGQFNSVQGLRLWS